MGVDGVGVGGVGVDGVGVNGVGVDGVDVGGKSGNGSLIGSGGDGKDVKEVSKGVVFEFYYGERCC